MQPADPRFADRVRDSFALQGAMRTLGARLERVEPGFVVIGMPHQATLTQQHGFIHAGMLSAALDSACGYAAFSLMPADAAVLTIEFKINLLAPARGPHFRFEGKVTKIGRTISVVDGRALQAATPDTEDGELIATMTATVMTVLGRAGLKH
jgi:uncharacterized protein (TIGR00369 family)